MNRRTVTSHRVHRLLPPPGAPKDHPAEGLYYVTVQMLENVNACPLGVGAVLRRARSRTRKVPITRQLLREVMASGAVVPLFWATDKMIERGRITYSEASRVTLCGGEGEKIERFLDLLAVRARREGRLR